MQAQFSPSLSQQKCTDYLFQLMSNRTAAVICYSAFSWAINHFRACLCAVATLPTNGHFSLSVKQKHLFKGGNMSEYEWGAKLCFCFLNISVKIPSQFYTFRLQAEIQVVTFASYIKNQPIFNELSQINNVFTTIAIKQEG